MGILRVGERHSEVGEILIRIPVQILALLYRLQTQFGRVIPNKVALMKFPEPS